jgi:LemA protein
MLKVHYQLFLTILNVIQTVHRIGIPQKSWRWVVPCESCFYYYLCLLRNQHEKITKMKNTVKLLVVLTFSVLVSSCGYNQMVTLDESCSGQWANVENAYQRRADLIPNLVNTVKGAAETEQEILTSVMEARAKATSTTIDANNLTPDKIAQFQQAQDGLSSALSRLLVTVERYPDIKSNQNFLELQAQLEGTENRISVERKKFNDQVNSYNSYIRQFPRVIYAGWFNFERKGYFEASPGSEQAPEVNFD